MVYDLNSPHYPDHSTVSNIAYSAGLRCRDCFVDGKILYHKGEYKTLDKERIIHEVNRIHKALF